jgi:hypothetical protein
MNHTPNYCSYCGWTHKKVTNFKVIEDGCMILRPICEDCKPTIKSVVCFNCGERDGDKLYPTTITLKVFENNGGCDVSVMLCEKCKTISHIQLYEANKVKFDQVQKKLCFTCPKKFLCFTSKEKGKTLQSGVKWSEKAGKFFQTNCRKV